jgi:hypothetical protein
MIQNPSGHYFSVERSPFISGGLPHSFSILLSPGIVMSGMRFGKNACDRRAKIELRVNNNSEERAHGAKSPY